MWLLWLTVSAWAADPAVNVTWKGDDGRLFVRAPEGEHVAEEAPFDVSLAIGTRNVTLTGFGSDLAAGVPVGAVRGLPLQGSLKVSFCEDGGSRCRLAEIVVTGALDTRRRGTAALVIGSAVTDDDQGFPAQADASRVFTSAVEQAKVRNLPILLDFGAVWCPPCQLMDAEVFRATPRASVVDAFVMARMDVDDPSSWDLKDQYAVGGYPTLVAIDATGRELGRQVGYRGPDDTITWLDAVATGRYAHKPGDPTPEEAAGLAWRSVEEGRDAAAAEYLKAAAAQPELTTFRLTRMHLTPNLDDALWLATRAPGHALDWVGNVGDLGKTPEGRDAVLGAIRADLATARALDAADLLYAAADFARDDAEKRMLYGSAAALVRTQLTGDPNHDKGHFDWLSLLTELSGRPDDAIKLLESARDQFPDEPTFHTYLARAQLRQGHADEALAAADRAFDTAWGDNKLTAAKVKVQALLLLDRKPEAVAFVDALLKEMPAPAPGVEVRTKRYRDDLTALLNGDAPKP